MMFRFEGRHRSVIFGAGGCIGGACVQAFADAGAEVVAVDLDEHRARASLSKVGGAHRACAVDVSDSLAVSELAEQLCGEEDFDSVVYCPGVTGTARVAEQDWGEYRRIMSINLDGAFFVTQAFSRPLLAAGRAGSFVYLCSISGLRGEAMASAYCASKFALVGLIESFAAENTGSGIRANGVAPGNVDSPMLQAVAAEIAQETGSSPDQVWEQLGSQGAAVRLVKPAEVAQACLWLASPLASGITGEVMRVDVGQGLDW